ncbi:MAG: hypothetical protein ACTSXP_03055 [Promethearchaeota archaeon]
MYGISSYYYNYHIQSSSVGIACEILRLQLGFPYHTSIDKIGVFLGTNSLRYILHNLSFFPTVRLVNQVMTKKPPEISRFDNKK